MSPKSARIRPLVHETPSKKVEKTHLADVCREGEGLPDQLGGRPPARQQSGSRGLPAASAAVAAHAVPCFRGALFSRCPPLALMMVMMMLMLLPLR